MDFNIKILIVDDNIALRRLLRITLKKLGFNNIIEAADGIEAVEELKKGDINLILSDMQMPNMTGLQLLDAIRKTEKLKKLPFIMVTAHGEKELVKESVKIGVTSFIVKPFSAEVILNKIITIFEKK